MVRVRMRGRNGRWVWRRQPVVTASAHGVGVHNFLTDAWASAQSPAAGRQATATEIDPVTGSSMSASPEGGANPTAAPSFSRPSGVEKPAGPSPAGAPAGQPDATRPRQINPTLGETHSINPLVAAYTESLEARGISPEYQGFIVATLNGDVLAEHNADRLFNPASVTKVATTLTAISRLGPDFRFKTYLYTDGTLDRSSGILHGSLYVVGSGDPAFFAENAMLIADKLNRTGIHEVDGNLFVLGQFYFNFSASREASAKALRAVLSGDSGATKSAFPRFLSMRSAEDRAGDSATTAQPVAPPKVKIAGQTITDPAVNTTRLTMIAVHTSLPLIRVLKGLNDFSNNWMATVIGSLVGGPDAVERFLKTEVGFREDEVNFATSSGLGSNAISPRGTVTILRKLISYLRTKGLGLEDMLPIAGVDAGTLEKRFTDAFRGSVVGKTGTLNGVSALAGVAYTRSKGPLLFVIYNHGRSAHTFRPIQDETIKKMITLYGGPSPVKWAPSIVPRVSERADGPGGSTAKNK
ncbi:MAG TPA: D-alanyl-D-alanine carboxypeptidase [Blastocatellia bacterium]|nr:D-alanyl-D-alanine carboxypeptidase [Blastocatellia bacterium]